MNSVVKPQANLRVQDGTERHTTTAHDVRELRRIVKEITDAQQIDGALLIVYPQHNAPAYVHFNSQVLYTLLGLGVIGYRPAQSESQGETVSQPELLDQTKRATPPG